MSLLSPTPGEMQDRLSILALKLHFKGATYHQVEYQQLAQALITWKGWPQDVGLRAKVSQVADRLIVVNTLLWIATDEHYAFTPEGPKDLERGADLLVRLRKLNKERVRLREEIDKLLGAFAGPEKV